MFVGKKGLVGTGRFELRVAAAQRTPRRLFSVQPTARLQKVGVLAVGEQD